RDAIAQLEGCLMTVISSANRNSLVRGSRWCASSIIATIILVIGALYCFVPILWLLLASTKTSNNLLSTFTFSIGSGLLDNLQQLFSYSDGAMIAWSGNSLIYAGGGALGCTFVSASAGYGLAKYEFRGSRFIFGAILSGVLIPGVVLAIPQY